MKIEIQKERENALLRRKEVRFNVIYEGGTPNLKDVRKELLSVLHSKDELTVVDSIMPGFGQKLLKGYAKVYKDEKDVKIEPAFRLNKNKGIKNVKKAAEAPKPEAKKEKK
jgi:small subunit ribosomal protein S24e